MFVLIENVGDVLTGMTDIDHHPGPAIAALMKLSFDEEHRQAICNLGRTLSTSD